MKEVRRKNVTELWCVALGTFPGLFAFGWLVYRLQFVWRERPDMQFGWIVVLLCGYLVLDRWDKKPPVVCRSRPGTMLTVGISLGLLFVVQVVMAAFGTGSAVLVLHSLATVSLCLGCLNFVFGWGGVRTFGFACAFILLAVPLPSAVQNVIIGNLQHFVAAFNTEVLALLGIPAERTGALIRLPAGTVGIDEACSGIRSLQSTAMATLFIGHVTLHRTSFQLLLFVAGMMLAVFGNLVRSLYLTLTANAKGIEAIEGVHDAAGWSILVFTTVGVIALSWLLNRLESGGEAGKKPEVQTAEAV